jgi:hypothetical protein
MITGFDDETPVARRAAGAFTHRGAGVTPADGDGDGEGLDEAVGLGEGGAAVPPLHATCAHIVSSATAKRFGLNLSSGPRECGVLWSAGGWWPAGST